VFEVVDPQLRDRVSDSREFHIRWTLRGGIPESRVYKLVIAGDLIDPPVIVVRTSADGRSTRGNRV
jgi:hypothetical protein